MYVYTNRCICMAHKVVLYYDLIALPVPLVLLLLLDSIFCRSHIAATASADVVVAGACSQVCKVLCAFVMAHKTVSVAASFVRSDCRSVGRPRMYVKLCMFFFRMENLSSNTSRALILSQFMFRFGCLV